MKLDYGCIKRFALTVKKSLSWPYKKISIYTQIKIYTYTTGI